MKIDISAVLSRFLHFKLDWMKINYDSNLFRRYFITSTILLLIRFDPVHIPKIKGSPSVKILRLWKFWNFLKLWNLVLLFFQVWKSWENETLERQRLSKFLFFQCLRFWKVTLTFDRSDWLKRKWTCNLAQSIMQRLHFLLYNL